MFATAGDGTKIWYEHVPGPRPVLLVHGFASDSHRTWEQTGWTRALAPLGYLALDLRGHGQSGRPTSGYSPGVLAADALTVLDEAAVSTVDAVAYSMGGLVAWQLARLAPGRIGRLVLGGIGGRTAGRADLAALGGPGLQACAEGMAGHGLAGEPPVPVLFAAGDDDELAADAPEFAASLGAPFVSLGRRNHFNAVSSRVFKEAALEFLGAGAPPGPDRR